MALEVVLSVECANGMSRRREKELSVSVSDDCWAAGARTGLCHHFG